MGQALIWAAAAFVAGGAMTLERRCLGQMALVQPLTLCPLAGLIAGQPEAGVWIGVCLQLYSHGHGRDADWALAGCAAALTLLYSPRLGLALGPGDPASLIAVALPLACALGSRLLERRLARTDGAALRLRSPWSAERPARALERLVRRRLARSLALGGLETLVAGGITILGAVAIGHWGGGGAGWRALVAVAVPALGAAVAVSALADQRLVALTGVGLAIAMAYGAAA